MLFSVSPRKSWRSMLRSFGWEQIVQVRATQVDSSAAAPRSWPTYSGTAVRSNREIRQVFAATTQAYRGPHSRVHSVDTPLATDVNLAHNLRHSELLNRWVGYPMRRASAFISKQFRPLC